MLGALEKDSFQDEVCARLATVIADFQRIPAKPHGDAGLDGLSHGQARAYCCYGPEQEPFKKNTRGLKADIIKKFQSDLRTIFEIEHQGKTLVRKPTAEMKTIIAPGRKLKNVYLIVSCFETHQIIAPLNVAFGEYKAASWCNYVDVAAEPTIWGPKDLATLWVVDEHALFRIENRALLARMKQAVAAGIAPTATGDFMRSSNMCVPKTRPSARRATDLRSLFRKAWSTALALDNSLRLRR